MKIMLELLGVSLIAAVCLSADSAQDIGKWFTLAMLAVCGGALLLTVAGLLPDGRRCRRRRGHGRRCGR